MGGDSQIPDLASMLSANPAGRLWHQHFGPGRVMEAPFDGMLAAGLTRHISNNANVEWRDNPAARSFSIIVPEFAAMEPGTILWRRRIS
jgi:hypothetical protein